MCAYLVEHYEEHFCEIILNLDWWIGRCLLKVVLVLALVAIFIAE